MEKLMKRICSAALTLILILSLLALTACGKNDGTPKDMQLVKGGENEGYYFYGPEEWVVANVGDIACTYASKIDRSSITFAQGEKPEGSVEEYFESEKAKLPYNNVSVTVNGEDCTFGNSVGKKFVYTYEYKASADGTPFSYTAMQIFVSFDGRFYIFTYTASNSERSDGQSYYEFYLEKVSSVIENFKLTSKSESEDKKAEYERDHEGHILVSDKTLSGFKMYVPDSYKVDHSSSMVSVTNSVGANITMSQLTNTGLTFPEYWQARKDSINALAGGTLTEIQANVSLTVPGTNRAMAYEYTYVLDGVSYHVYQVIVIESAVNGYVFTYTASEEHYTEHLSEAEIVLQKITY